MIEKTADENDHATSIAEEYLQLNIGVIRKKAAAIDISNSTGLCFSRGNEIGNRRFCDKDCADIWSRENE